MPIEEIMEDSMDEMMGYFVDFLDLDNAEGPDGCV